jgi:hypothetical protein
MDASLIRWLGQTKITTRYSIKPVKPRTTEDTESASDAAATTTTTTAAATAKPPRGSLVFKTYDPQSGVCLKYRTTKAAEVSRLVYSSLGRLGRGLAAVPEPPAAGGDDAMMVDAPSGGVATPTEGAGAGDWKAAPAQAQGGGGKKKKKGKK